MIKKIKDCLVDIDNYFEFGGMKFKIDKREKAYAVQNPYSKTNQHYSNSAEMIYISVAINTSDNKLLFFDENKNEVVNVSFVEMVGV